MKLSSFSPALWLAAAVGLASCGVYAPPYKPAPPLPAVGHPDAMGVEPLEEDLPEAEKPLTDEEVSRQFEQQKAVQKRKSGGFANSISTYLRGTRAVQVGDITTAKEIYLGQVGKTHNTQQDMMYRRQAFNFALAEGDMDTASSLAKTFTPAQNPENTVWLLQMVEAIQAKDWKNAKRFLRRGVKGMPKLQHFVLMKALLDFQTGALTEKDLDTLVARFDPLSALQAQWAYNRGRMYALFPSETAQDEKLALYQDAYKADAGAVFSVMMLGQTLQEVGEADTANTLLERFHSLPSNALVLPDFPVPASLTAEEKLQERMGEYLFGIGMLMWAQGLDVPALHMLHLARFQLAGLHSPLQEMMSYYMAMVFEQTNRKDLAEAVYRSLPVDCVPRYAVAARLANMAYANGKTEDARAMLEFFLKEVEGQQQPSPVVLKTLAEVAYKAEDFQEALAFYNAILGAVETLPEDAQLQFYFARGVSLERTGNMQAAGKLFDKALELDPENATILNYVGYMWLDAEGMKLTQEKLQKAYTYISKAATLDPNNAAILDSLGWVYYKQGEYAKAQLYLLKAMEIEPEDPTILEHMGDVSAALGDMVRARNYWRMALDIDTIGDREKQRVTEKLNQ